jgi:hypothetical protein
VGGDPFGEDIAPLDGAGAGVFAGEVLEEIADGCDVGDFIGWDADAELAFQDAVEFHACEGVEAGVEFQVGGWAEDRGGSGEGLDAFEECLCAGGTQQGLVFVAEGGSGGGFFDGLEGGGLDFGAPEFSEPGAGKVAGHDVHAIEAHVGRQALADFSKGLEDGGADADDLASAQFIEVGHDEGGESIDAAVRGGIGDDAEFLDERALFVVVLHLVGVDIFAGGHHDDFLGPAGDGEVSVAIEESEVSGMEPSVADHLGGFVRSLVVAVHDIGAADEDFAGAVFAGVVDAEFHVGQGFAHAAGSGLVGDVERHDGRGFGEAVALDHGEAEVQEVLCDGGVEFGAAAGEEPECGSEWAVDGGEEEAAGGSSRWFCAGRGRGSGGGGTWCAGRVGPVGCG